MIGTAVLAALLAIFAGLIRPEWVHRRRAFGWSVMLALTVMLLYGVNWDVRAWGELEWHRLLSAASVLLSLVLIGTRMCAYWPGGKLFSVGGKANSAEE
jgi:hypothetical protein